MAKKSAKRKTRTKRPIAIPIPKDWNVDHTYEGLNFSGGAARTAGGKTSAVTISPKDAERFSKGQTVFLTGFYIADGSVYEVTDINAKTGQLQLSPKRS